MPFQQLSHVASLKSPIATDFPHEYFVSGVFIRKLVGRLFTAHGPFGASMQLRIEPVTT
jgi:hypothetical protein